jgi:hypothetical protein
MKAIPPIFRLLCVGFLLLNLQLRADMLFRDGDFDSSDWLDITLVTDDPRYANPAPDISVGTVSRLVVGGNPDGFRKGSHNIVGGDNVWTGGIYSAATYDPSVDGALAVVQIDADLRMFAAGETAFQLVVRQNGIDYYNVPFGEFSGNSWKKYTLKNLRTDDFDTNPNVGLPNAVPTGLKPDFSRSGADSVWVFTW